MFILCSRIVIKSKYILVKFTFSICNQQLFFTFVIPYSPYNNDDDNNDSKPPTLISFLNFLMEPMWKNMGTSSGWNAKIDDIMVIDSIVMTTCMSPFSKPFLDFDSMPNFSTFTYMFLCNATHIFLYEVISPSKWSWSKLPYSINHNANMHSLEFPCSYLQFNQRCHTY